MAAKDIYHDSFVRALQKDGWSITHDPLSIQIDSTTLLIDIGAEQMVTADRNDEHIAVEIKSFVSLSAVQDLKEAVGQFWLYELALQKSPEHRDRTLFLAIRDEMYQSVFVKGIGKLFLENDAIRFIIFDPATEEIREWIK
jgi:hypothetical protein